MLTFLYVQQQIPLTDLNMLRVRSVCNSSQLSILIRTLDPTCKLLHPHRKIPTTDRAHSAQITRVFAALATRYGTSTSVVRRLLKGDLDMWGKIRRVDSDAGDTMVAADLAARVEEKDRRDATHIRVSGCMSTVRTYYSL